MRAFELVVAGLLGLGAIGSLMKWMRTGFDARTVGDQVLFSIHAASRVALWIAFAGLFAGYALVDEPQEFKWFVLVPIGVAGLQVLTGMLLARSRGDE